MHKHWPWILPLLAMMLLAPFTPWLDLTISRFFYNPQTGFAVNAFYNFMFDWGTKPAFFLAVISFIIFCSSWFVPEYEKWRRVCLYLSLTLAVGSGIIVNLVLKDHWGRPRPKQVIEFGGFETFRPFYDPNFFSKSPEPLKSFPCGHCAMGFYFFALAFAGKRLGNRTLYRWGIALTIILGVLLSYVRIAQGGHFFSDTVVSALIMWLTAYTLHQWIPEHERTQ